MKKCLSIFLASLMLLAGMLTTSPKALAASKNDESRAIAIVFDNSGSMYIKGEQAWCRATYAMEVFASMLNKGDTLSIYPMHPITVDGKEYTMDKPFKITDASQASKIRDIYTPDAQGTPIESIDCAIKGIQTEKASKKYVIVLTDGDVFYKNDGKLSTSATKKELDNRFKKYASESLTMMYLGIGEKVIMPDTKQSEYFVKKQAKNSADTLSALTDMCNQIFGRDTLPKNHISGNKISLDISISKLIVFVQGEKVSKLKLSGSDLGKQVSSTSTKYGTKGAGNYKSTPDKSLQGMMVTYENCAAGTYTIEYSGKATSIEVYYEPNADLDFVFTDADGNDVDPNALYEGEYKVSFGMKDAKTGKLIESDLLGEPKYQGSYSINGQEYPIECNGYSGEVPISLKMNDSFDANLTVNYLSGYTISKDSSDFGWPKGGIKVAARPAGKLKLEISGGDKKYSLQDLEKGSPYIAKVYYKGKLLTGKELEKVQLKWQPENSSATIKYTFAEDHYKLTLHYKDEKNPQDTECGGCTVPIYAFYAAQGSSQAQASDKLTYRIEDDTAPIQLAMSAPQDYIVIKEIAESKEIIVSLKMDGKPLSAEDFDAVKLNVDCSGLEHTVTPDKENSQYLIKLLDSENIKEDDYPINVTATYTDRIGRTSEADDALSVTLSNTPLWQKWLWWIFWIIVFIVAVWFISRIKVLPRKVRHKNDDCYMTVGGKDVGGVSAFRAPLTGKKVAIKTQYSGETVGVNLNKLQPGKDSYLYKRQHKKSMVVDPANVGTIGEITYIDVNGATFELDKKEGKVVPSDPDQKPILLREGATIVYEGLIDDNGKTKKFHSEVPLTFKK